MFLLAALMLLCGAQAEEKYQEMPTFLRVTQQTHEEEIVKDVTIRRTYPETACESVNAEMRALVDGMAEKNREKLPEEPGSLYACLDVGPVITRTGTSWMSFLTLAEVSYERAQLSVDYDARVYDTETGGRVTLKDVFPPESDAWALMAQQVQEQLTDAFPQETPDTQALEALCTREALESATFILGAARLSLIYRADSVYPGKNTLLHVHLYYPEIRKMMTERAQEQTDNSRFNLIALTYDDGPARGYTRGVMDLLRQHGAQATFFVVGEQIGRNRDNLARQQDSGYSIQSHTYTHSYPGKLGMDGALEEKARFEAELSAVTGMRPSMMRAPGGMEEKYVEWAIGYPLIHWSVASGDSANKDIEGIAQRVIRQAGDGDIVLLHDLNMFSPQYTKKILKEMSGRGILFVTLEELFAARGVPLEENRVYFRPDRVEDY